MVLPTVCDPLPAPTCPNPAEPVSFAGFVGSARNPAHAVRHRRIHTQVVNRHRGPPQGGRCRGICGSPTPELVCESLAKNRRPVRGFKGRAVRFHLQESTTMPQVTMRQMLEAGVHFGHQTRYWNPKMAPYIFGARGKIHIINLEKTVPLFTDAMNFLSAIAQKRGSILFIGTKRSARDAVKEEATRCGMPYMTQRWLGGTLTNFRHRARSPFRRLDEHRSRRCPTPRSRYQRESKKCSSRRHDARDARQRRSAATSKACARCRRSPTRCSSIDIRHEGDVRGASEAKTRLNIPIIGRGRQRITDPLPRQPARSRATTTRSVRCSCTPAPPPMPCSKARPPPRSSVAAKTSSSSSTPKATRCRTKTRRSAPPRTTSVVLATTATAIVVRRATSARRRARVVRTPATSRAPSNAPSSE